MFVCKILGKNILCGYVKKDNFIFSSMTIYDTLLLHMPQKYSFFFHEIMYVGKKWVDVLTIFILKFIKYDIYVFFIISACASTRISQGNQWRRYHRVEQGRSTRLRFSKPSTPTESFLLLAEKNVESGLSHQPPTLSLPSSWLALLPPPAPGLLRSRAPGLLRSRRQPPRARAPC
jgi:hypothetical protein